MSMERKETNEKKKMKKSTVVLIVCAGLLAALILTVAAALTVLHVRTTALDDDYSSIFSDEKYQTPVGVDGVEVVKQEVSCGYAVIEMFSGKYGGEITEEKLYEEYGKVVTSTGGSFCEEMNKRFPEYKTEMRKWLTNRELIDAVYESLSEGMAVPIEWAAQLDGEWTLHYSLVVGADIPGDRITVANPYGYTEELTVKEFLDRTSFQAYDDMPLFLRLGFAFGIFEKNTVFIVH